MAVALDLTGRTALVTGSTRGTGLAIATGLAADLVAVAGDAAVRVGGRYVEAILL